MRFQSKKRQARMAEVKPIRQGLIDRVGECELCGASAVRPNRSRMPGLSQLCCHEIANGPHRDKALDKPYAILVLCWYCNGNEVTNKREWPEAKQLALLALSRPEDFDVRAFCSLINPNAPNRVTYEEVVEELVMIKGIEESTLLNLAEVALIMRVNRKTVWSWIDNKELRAIDVAPANAKRSMWRVEPKDVVIFARSRTTLDVQAEVPDESLEERIAKHEAGKRKGHELLAARIRKQQKNQNV